MGLYWNVNGTGLACPSWTHHIALSWEPSDSLLPTIRKGHLRLNIDPFVPEGLGAFIYILEISLPSKKNKKHNINEEEERQYYTTKGLLSGRCCTKLQHTYFI